MKETKKLSTKNAKPKAIKTTVKVKKTKKIYSPDDAHWIKSQAKLVKIMEAAGIRPENNHPMLTCHRDR